MPFFWCEATRLVSMNVEADDALSAVRRFEEFNAGMRPDSIDDREIKFFCMACERPIFAGDYLSHVFGVDDEGRSHGYEGTTCLACLTGHGKGGEG
jgi:hypothetical protein